MDKLNRQAGAYENEITEEMIGIGARALSECIPLDVATPVLPTEDIVVRIYRRMKAADPQGVPANRSPRE
jgi:hypothetical protein